MASHFLSISMASLLCRGIQAPLLSYAATALFRRKTTAFYCTMSASQTGTAKQETQQPSQIKSSPHRKNKTRNDILKDFEAIIGIETCSIVYTHSPKHSVAVLTIMVLRRTLRYVQFV